MIAPFSIEEKQKLIETIALEKKIKVLEEIIDFNLVEGLQSNLVQ